MLKIAVEQGHQGPDQVAPPPTSRSPTTEDGVRLGIDYEFVPKGGVVGKAATARPSPRRMTKAFTNFLRRLGRGSGVSTTSSESTHYDVGRNSVDFTPDPDSLPLRILAVVRRAPSARVHYVDEGRRSDRSCSSTATRTGRSFTAR